MWKVTEEALKELAIRAGAALIYKSGYVQEVGDENWVRRVKMYRRLYNRCKNDELKIRA
ncbi:hypothetical protein ACFVS2_21195 [Brevibacillus sp. NPDC058079]|uniref:hypothetical protein n=1 Tax=Brevibacillus sp. NPDC058079 TaxID=3346330 RepID=UPI0036EDF287